MKSILVAEGLRVSYGGVRAVDDVTLAIPEGSIVGLIGPNGAGKSSLIDALTGYVRPAGGTVKFLDEEVTRLRPHLRARRGLARTFQAVELFDDLTVRENLLASSDDLGPFVSLAELFAPRWRPHEAVDWALTVCDLHDVADSLPSVLPHGRRKLVGVARALARRPRVVLLDEPAAGLDTHETELLGQRLCELPGKGVSALLVDHDMGLVLSVCDFVYVLDFGRLIASGTPSEVRRSPEVIAAYLGSQAEVRHGSF
jgi:branched-chain amino acid transport system ATP-binding protein